MTLVDDIGPHLLNPRQVLSQGLALLWQVVGAGEGSGTKPAPQSERAGDARASRSEPRFDYALFRGAESNE